VTVGLGRTARRPFHAITTGLLVLGVAGGLLSACSGSAVEVTAVPEHVSAACDKPDQLWPKTVARQQQRPVTPENPDASAWGDPAIIATCGWPELGPTTEQCIQVDGVDWVAHQLSDGVRFRTFGRIPVIEVLVPHAYAPEPLLLPAFGPAAKALPADGHSCS
jgi:hypothetical protein